MTHSISIHSSNQTKIGTLYVVATPIGNLEDLSLRASRILQEVNFVAAEDTRVSGLLLQHIGSSAKLFSLREHNESEASLRVIELLKSGFTVAQISDAGTPAISDPGMRLVRAVQDAQLPVVAIPGACAAVTALSGSGILHDSFLFLGFLPAKNQARETVLKEYEYCTSSIVLYEAPHRILDTLQSIITVLGPDREICMAREITKTFETYKRLPAKALLEWAVSDRNQQKGEIVLVLAGKGKQDLDELTEGKRVLALLLEQNLPLKQCVKLAVDITGASKNALYEWGLTLKNA